MKHKYGNKHGLPVATTQKLIQKRPEQAQLYIRIHSTLVSFPVTLKTWVGEKSSFAKLWIIPGKDYNDESDNLTFSQSLEFKTL